MIARDDIRPSGHTTAHPRADGEDRIVAALAHLRGAEGADREASGTPNASSEETRLEKWARRVGLLLDPADYLPHLERGGQEHDLITETDHVIKATRHGVFGLSPGIELALVSSSQDEQTLAAGHRLKAVRSTHT